MSRFQTLRKESARRHRRANGFLAGILVAALVLGLSAMLYTDSYEQALEQQRQMLYGAWHVAGYGVSEAAAETYAAHTTVEEVGQMTLYGTVQSDGAILGGLGRVDETLVELVRLTLLDGAWPTQPEEIAVESGCLTRLGYAFDLGQTLTLTIAWEDSAGETVTQEKTFRLTGVLQDYAANWKREGATLASFLVSENPVPAANETRHIFLSLRPEFLDSAPDLAQMAGQTGKFVVNDYTYLRYAPANQPAYDRILLQLLVTGLSCLTLVLLMTLDLRQRRETLVLLRGLGATRGQIALLYLGEKVPVLLLATAAGLIMGLGLPAAALAVAARLLRREALLSLVPLHLAQFLGLYAGSLVLALLVGLVRLFQIPLRGKALQQAAMPRRRRARRLSPKNMYRVLASLHPGAGWASFGLALFSALVLLFTAYRAWDQGQSYRFQSQNYPADYAYGFLQNRFSTGQGMDDATLQAISQAYGVETVRAFAMAEPMAMTHPGGFTSAYAQAAAEFMGWDEGTVCGSPLSVSDNVWERYLAAVEPEQREAIRRGEAVLLYVPDLVGADLQPVGTVEEAEPVVRETNIAPGETLTLETPRGKAELKVGGVAQDLSFLPFSLLPIRPYTILCSEGIYESLVGEITYCYVEVLGDPAAVSYQTDLALSRISTGLAFSNHRIARQSLRQQLLLQLILAVVLLVSCGILVGILRFGLESAQAQGRQRTRELLWRLGADGRKLRRTEALLSLRHRVAASLVAAMVLLLWEALEEAAALRAMANFESFRAQWPSMTVERFLQNTHWLFLALLLTAFWLASFASMAMTNFKAKGAAI